MQALLEEGLKEIALGYQHIAAYLCSDLSSAKYALSHLRETLTGGYSTVLVRADEQRPNDVDIRNMDTSKILFVGARTVDIYRQAKEILRGLGHTNNLLETNNATPHYATRDLALSVLAAA